MKERYIRQETYRGIGREGQQRLFDSKVAVIGLGAVGSVVAEGLARSGVGFLRLADRDVVDETNLPRMALYTEEDAEGAVPKAEAACRHILQRNAGCRVERIITDVNSSNVDGVIEGMDLVIDGTDNHESKFLLNEACFHGRVPWIYTAAVGSAGQMIPFLQEENEPCLRCLMSYDGVKDAPTCTTEGVLGMMTGMLGQLVVQEAVKILIGSPDVIKGRVFLESWRGLFREIEVSRREECPVCGYHQFSFYGTTTGTRAAALCGKDSVQVVPAEETNVDFEALAKKLAPFGEVKRNAFTLDFDDGEVGVKVFRNARAIIKNITDLNRAKALYTRYIENNV